jgi:8-oxo-dGTP pyrophosphatase MutT (NUDIX family)
MSEIIYQGKVINLRLDPVQLEDGRTVKLEIVEHAPSIGVLALKDERTALLVRQYRHSAGETLREIVAGSLDAGEAPEEAAQRELAEEIGYRAQEMITLGGFYLCPGYTTEFMHIFLARGLEPATAEADEDEQIELEAIPLTELYRQARAGELKDAKTVAALLLAEARLPGASESPRRSPTGAGTRDTEGNSQGWTG